MSLAFGLGRMQKKPNSLGKAIASSMTLSGTSGLKWLAKSSCNQMIQS